MTAEQVRSRAEEAWRSIRSFTHRVLPYWSVVTLCLGFAIFVLRLDARTVVIVETVQRLDVAWERGVRDGAATAAAQDRRILEGEERVNRRITDECVTRTEHDHLAARVLELERRTP